MGMKDLEQMAEHDSRPKKLKFEEKYTRFTNYLRNDLYEKLIDMKYDDKIKSMTEGINDAVAEYIDRYYK